MSYQVENTSNQDGKKIGGGAIMSLIGLGGLAIFVFQNTGDVAVSFLWVDFTWPIWLLTIVSAVLGTFVWIGLGIVRRHRRRKARRN